MGKKKTADEVAKQAEKAAETEAPKTEEKKTEGSAEAAPKEEEDAPIIKELKVIDDKYLELQKEFEKKANELQLKYEALQAPLLTQRTEVLTKADGESKSGTPACPSFWLEALKHHPATEDEIQDWDCPVLEHLVDIKKLFLDEADIEKGFRLEFHFSENEFFTDKVLWKEFHVENASPYTGEIEVKEIKCSKVDWKPGKDVTVETIKKKTKGGGAKKQKQKGKETQEPRDSFFRNVFRNLKAGDPVPDDVNDEEARQMMDDEDDDDEMMNMLMENDHEIGMAIRDQLIPFAVRWYTGEAAPEQDDDEDDEEEDDDDAGDDEEDESEEDDEPPARGGKKAQAKGKAAGAKKGADGAAPKQEECKQQ